MIKFPWPVYPYRGPRGLDASGGGGFGAPRGDKTHPGLDCTTVMGDHIVALFDSQVHMRGIAYMDNPSTPLDESELGSFHLRNPDWWVQYLYLRPSKAFGVGDYVFQGDCVGFAQDRSKYSTTVMTNHVHVRIRHREVVDGEEKWVLVDPAIYLLTPEDSND